jgi:hypothetical protein
MRRLKYIFFLSLPLIFICHLKFLSWGSKSVQIFLSCFDLNWGCSKCVRICSICVLNFAGAALFRSRTEIEVTILLCVQNLNWAAPAKFRTQIEQMRTHYKQPQVAFETNWRIWKLYEPQHKNLKCLLKIKGTLIKKINIRRLMS